jgi:hypothetical protein
VSVRLHDTDSESDEEDNQEHIPNHRRRRVRIPLQNITGLAYSAMLAGDRINPDTPTTMEQSEDIARRRIHVENNRRRREALANSTHRGMLSNEDLLYIDRRHPNQTIRGQNQLLGRENRYIYYYPNEEESLESENNRMTREERIDNRRRSRSDMEGIGLKRKEHSILRKMQSIKTYYESARSHNSVRA